MSKDLGMLKPSRVWLIFFLVVASWLACGFGLYAAFEDWQSRGQFGDQFGAVNALFSGLAFAAIAITMIYQRRDLELQMSELAKSTRALAEQAKMQRAQCYAQLAQLRVAAAEAQMKLSIVEGRDEPNRHDVVAFEALRATISVEADRLEALLKAIDEQELK